MLLPFSNAIHNNRIEDQGLRETEAAAAAERIFQNVQILVPVGRTFYGPDVGGRCRWRRWMVVHGKRFQHPRNSVWFH